MHELIGKLYAAGFFLQGSRFFGKEKADSDWDFFCDDGENRYKWLDANGFTPKALPYLDDLTMTTWKHKDHPIEVSTRSDEEVFKRALVYIKLSGSYEHLLNKANVLLIDRIGNMNDVYNIVRDVPFQFHPVVKYPQNINPAPVRARGKGFDWAVYDQMFAMRYNYKFNNYYIADGVNLRAEYGLE